MIQLKNSDLFPVLITILAVNSETGVAVSGLLTENITLGTRRKLQKIHKKALTAYQEFQTDEAAIIKEFGEDKEKMEKELKELYDESVKIDVEPIFLSSLENVSTKNNYSFDIIEKIAT